MNQVPTKVLFLITKATWGGAQRYVFDLATHLPIERFAVSIAYGTHGRLIEKLREHNIARHHLSALGRDIALVSDITSFFQILALLRQEKPDVLHVNSSKAAALGALAARLAGTRKIIFTAHGLPFKEDRNAIARAIIYFISWFTALLSHATIVVSKHDETIGKQTPFIGEKVRYIPIGIETPSFLPREEAARALSITTTARRIVTIAELTKNKGIRYAIEAIAKLKDVEYFIIGDGELRQQLERYAKESGVANRVHFLGFIDNASKYLKAFDTFVLPSIKEGAPYVLLEAAQAGLPIVATDVIDESIATNPTVTRVPARNTSVLAETIERIIESGDQKSGGAIPSLENMIQTTIALYSY